MRPDDEDLPLDESSEPERPPAEDPEKVLRRIEKWMLFWALVGALGWSFLAPFEGLLFLTGGALAGIVLFRGLQRATRRWATPPEEKTDSISALPIILRFGILALLPVSTLWLDDQQALALIVGFTSLPLGLTSEAVSQFFWPTRAQIPSDPDS